MTAPKVFHCDPDWGALKNVHLGYRKTILDSKSVCLGSRKTILGSKSVYPVCKKILPMKYYQSGNDSALRRSAKNAEILCIGYIVNIFTVRMLTFVLPMPWYRHLIPENSVHPVGLECQKLLSCQPRAVLFRSACGRRLTGIGAIRNWKRHSSSILLRRSGSEGEDSQILPLAFSLLVRKLMEKLFLRNRRTVAAGTICNGSIWWRQWIFAFPLPEIFCIEPWSSQRGPGKW